jgi:sulfofructose kinase
MLTGMPMQEALDFSNAAAALNCTAIGARGHIASRTEVDALLASPAAGGENRRIDSEIAERCGTRVAVATNGTTGR